jgi:GDPmannose 4,6-dehydratase
MKKALITGIRGQDGAYLAELLLKNNYEVYGADRRSGESSNWRLKELKIEDRINIVHMDLLELTNIINVIKEIQPDEVYNLAAQSFVKTSFDQPLLSSNIDAMGVLRVIETLREFCPDAKFYQASTSEMFGNVNESPQSENTPFYPRSPYGVAKLFGHWITVNYRESYDMFACSGILFNHESPLRGLEFVTRKLTHGIARIKHGLQDKIVVGNLESKRDWGYAPEYVEAMWLMLQQDKPDDFVIATGEHHSVREFVEASCHEVGIDIQWKGKGLDEKGFDSDTGNVIVEIDKRYFRPSEVDSLLGDPTKAKEMLGWNPQTSFNDLVSEMAREDLKLIEAEK